MGYTKSALESSLRYEKDRINKCNEVLKLCDNHQQAFDELIDKIDNGTDAGGASDCYVSLNMLNTIYSQETFDKYDTYLMMSYLEFKEAYNSGENPYDFFDEILDCREYLINGRKCLIEEFERMKERYNYYIASINNIRKSMNEAINNSNYNIRVFQKALDEENYDE